GDSSNRVNSRAIWHLRDICANSRCDLAKLAENVPEQVAAFPVRRHMPPFPDSVTPCAVIASNHDLGLRGIRHDGPCSLAGLLSRKSGSCKDVVVSVVCLPCCSECVIHVGF